MIDKVTGLHYPTIFDVCKFPEFCGGFHRKVCGHEKDCKPRYRLYCRLNSWIGFRLNSKGYLLPPVYRLS